MGKIKKRAESALKVTAAAAASAGDMIGSRGQLVATLQWRVVVVILTNDLYGPGLPQ